MKIAKSLIFFFFLFSSAISNAQIAAGAADPMKGILRWGSIPISREEVFLLLPDGFPMATSWESGNAEAYQAGFFPNGQSKESWTDTIRLMAFRGAPPGDAPAKQMLSIIEYRIRESCPNDFIFEPVEQVENKRYSAAMGCRKLGNNSAKTTLGYYLAIQGSGYMYVIARESRHSPFSGDIPVSKSIQDEWRQQTDRTTICKRNEMCAKK